MPQAREQPPALSPHAALPRPCCDPRPAAADGLATPSATAHPRCSKPRPRPSASAALAFRRSGLETYLDRRRLFLRAFPDMRFTDVERDEYNRLMADQYAAIRDFIILHYAATRRDDTPFWRYVRTMALPDTLARKIALFREKGRIFRYDDELFGIPSWVAVMLGQGIVPDGYDPVVDALDEDRTADALRRIRASNLAMAQQMPMAGAN